MLFCLPMKWYTFDKPVPRLDAFQIVRYIFNQ